MIRLTNAAGRNVWASPTMVVVVLRHDRYTEVILSGTDQRLMVTESPEQVVNMVTDALSGTTGRP